MWSFMKRIILTAAILRITLMAHGQGQFTVNFKGDGNDIRFLNADGTPFLGTEGYSVEVFAGPNTSNLQPLGSMALNRTSPASDLGYPKPFAETFTVGTVGAGSNVNVGYALFSGADYATSNAKGPIVIFGNGLVPGNGPILTVTLGQTPSTVALGIGTYQGIPEPAPLILVGIGLIGLVTSRRSHLHSRRETQKRSGMNKCIPVSPS
jgi:hypothetical protein